MDSSVSVSSPLARFRHSVGQRTQVLLDRSSPHPAARWIALVGVLLLYVLRVWLIRGFYIVSYGLGIYNLNLLLGFLTPQVDPEQDGPELPSKEQEFRPFIRRLPEFKFWYSAIKSVCMGLGMTFFSVFDVPVFWPILLLYWLVLFGVTMKRQVAHMIKHRYLPFTIGKKKYKGIGKSKDKASSL